MFFKYFKGFFLKKNSDILTPVHYHKRSEIHLQKGKHGNPLKTNEATCIILVLRFLNAEQVIN